MIVAQSPLALEGFVKRFRLLKIVQRGGMVAPLPVDQAKIVQRRGQLGLNIGRAAERDRIM